MHPVIVTIGALELLRRRMDTEKKRPIVFVPGLYGSMSDEIVPQTGEWTFGMAASIYDPFIQSLEKMGYKKDENLFIAFYDWRKDCSFCAKKYLKNVINEAKRITKAKKVDIICHSMGGLVSRAYAQSNYYERDIEQLMIIGTPNIGATDAYYFWEGGRLPSNRNRKNNIEKIIIEGYLWVLKKIHKTENDMEIIHKYLLGARDLMPCKEYGNYLYTIEQNENKSFIQYENMIYKNDFLDSLYDTSNLLKKRNIKVTLIGGKGLETNELLRVEPNNVEKWPDGRVISSINSTEGDGTVMLKSLFAIDGDQYTFEGSHADVLNRCNFVVRKKLGIENDNTTNQMDYNLNNYISIRVKGNGKISIKEIDKKKINVLYDEETKEEDIYVEKYDESLQWILIKNKLENRTYLEYEALDKADMEIIIEDSLGRTKRINEIMNKNKFYRIKLS